MAFSLSYVPLKIDQFLEQFEIHSKIQWKVQGVPTYPLSLHVASMSWLL